MKYLCLDDGRKVTCKIDDEESFCDIDEIQNELVKKTLLLKQYVDSEYSDDIIDIFDNITNLKDDTNTVLFKAFILAFYDNHINLIIYQGVDSEDLFNIQFVLNKVFDEIIFIGRYNHCLECNEIVLDYNDYICQQDNCNYKNIEFLYDASSVYVIKLLKDAFDINIRDINSGLIEDKKNVLFSDGYTSENNDMIHNPYIVFLEKEDYEKFVDILNYEIIEDIYHNGDRVDLCINYHDAVDETIKLHDRTLTITSNTDDIYNFWYLIKKIITEVSVDKFSKKPLEMSTPDDVIRSAFEIVNG